MSPIIRAIVLAAGNSKRIGSPKALLELEGKFFIQHICENLRLAGVSDRIIVLGKDSKRILSSWKSKSEKVIINPEPDLGQISSLRVGLEADECSADGYMVCLVDMPAIKPETYKQIIDFWIDNKDCIVIPKYIEDRGQRTEDRGQRSEDRGQRTEVRNCFASPQILQSSKPGLKRGHPIIIPAIYRRLCFEGPLDKGLHWVTHHPGVKVMDLKVNDKNILTDIDTQKDYEVLSSTKNKK